MLQRMQSMTIVINREPKYARCLVVIVRKYVAVAVVVVVSELALEPLASVHQVPRSQCRKYVLASVPCCLMPVHQWDKYPEYVVIVVVIVITSMTAESVVIDVVVVIVVVVAVVVVVVVSVVV